MMMIICVLFLLLRAHNVDCFLGTAKVEFKLEVFLGQFEVARVHAREERSQVFVFIVLGLLMEERVSAAS